MKRSIGAWAVAMLLATLGCGRSDAPRDGVRGSESQPRAGGTLLRRLETDITTLNPLLATGRYDRSVAQYLFTPLLHVDADLRPAPGLAESWTMSPDGRVYTFKLNPKATFSDRRPVRASDVVFTLRKIVDPDVEAQMIASGFDFLDVTRTRAVDDHTVEVAFREAIASQPLQFNNVLVVPEHVYAKGDFRSSFNDKAVGSGPYTLVRWVPGQEVVLRRREDHWEQRPWIETVFFKVVSSHATAWNAAKIGALDETPVQSDVWVREQRNPNASRRLHFLRFYGLFYNYIAWNGRNPLFADKRVRRALGMCLDTPAIINNLYAGTARAVNGHFVPEQWAFNPAVSMLAFDPPGAAQILTSAGWMDTDGDGLLDRRGVPFRFALTVMSGSAQALTIAQAFQATLKEIGIQLDISVLDGAVAIQRILSGNYEAAYLSWDLDPDPDPFSLFHSSQIPPRGQNFVYYASLEANALMEAGRREMNTEKRVEIYQRLHEVLAEDQPYTWVTQPSQKWVFSDRVNGVRESKGWGPFFWHPGELGWWLSGAPRGGASAPPPETSSR